MATSVTRERIQKLRDVLRERGCHGVILTQEATIAWLYQGRYHIGVATDASCVAVLVTEDEVHVLVNNIEEQRLKDEEGLVADSVIVHSWADDALREQTLAQWKTLSGIVSEWELAPELQRMRMVQDEAGIRHLRELGVLVARALTQTCVHLRPGVTEFEAAGMLSANCLNHGVEAIVNLVAGERRAPLYRHVMPTNDAIERYAILSVGGRKNGLVVSATRMVAFGEVPSHLRAKYEAVLQVEAALLSASAAGSRVDAVLERGMAQYEAEGFPEEWHFHHQGGVGGYLPREVRAVPESKQRLEENMFVAWNPTISGVKAEDTAIVTAQGAEILTVDGDFPSAPVRHRENEWNLPRILVL